MKDDILSSTAIGPSIALTARIQQIERKQKPN
jgi:hypothetical protein